MRSPVTAALAVLLWVAAGCSGPAARENYYTLSSPGPTSVPDAPGAVTIYVGPVTVPESVDRNAMVLRTSPNQVEISDTERWAEPLKGAIARVLGDVLSREMGTVRVMTSRPAATLAFDYRVAVEIQRFESSLDDGALIDAVWMVSGPKVGTLRTGRTVAKEPAAARTPAALAAAHSRALEKLGRDIAAAMK
jgi:hypothetical protein